MAETWLLCSACRSDIAFGSQYFQCSVSTCNRARTRLVFCSVACWDSHVATARHRDAWAEDKIAPTKATWEHEQASEPGEPARSSSPARPATPDAPRPAPLAARPGRPETLVGTPPPASATTSQARPATSPAPPAAATRRLVGDPAPTQTGAPGVHLNDTVDRDMLIVVSKLKKYIKDRSGMNCSDAVAEVLSDHIRVLCDDSIRAAGRDERKTVLDRDVPRPRRP